jgi:hypothetical protein
LNRTDAQPALYSVSVIPQFRTAGFLAYRTIPDTGGGYRDAGDDRRFGRFESDRTGRGQAPPVDRGGRQALGLHDGRDAKTQ